VDERVIDPLIAALADGARIVVPRYEGGRGNPVLFSAEVAPELVEVTGDQGGRAVVRRDPGRVREVVLALPEPRDVDFQTDVELLDEH
jgi:molybdenum cofactor cytidylyltransferase